MRQHLTVLLAAVAVLLVGYGGYAVLFTDPAHSQLTVASVAGTVTRVDPTGATSPASPGDALRADAGIRVGGSGHALLVAGEGSQIMLESDTTVRVLSADRRGVQVELDEGRVQARVQSGSRILSVQAGERTARATDGSFRVAKDSDGFVRVVTEAGTVDVDGPDGPTILSTAQRLDAPPTGPATVSDAAMEEILLQVQWGTPTVGSEPVAIRGTTVPHAAVSISGPDGVTALRADAAGQFESALVLPPGSPHDVRVEVTDGLGSPRSDSRVLARPVVVPTATTEVRFGG